MAFAHAVTGVVRANGLRRRGMARQTGIDPLAWVLQAEQSRLAGRALHEYPETEIAARDDTRPRSRSEPRTGTISVDEFVLFAEQRLEGAIARGP
jgi:hypothetical protein